MQGYAILTDIEKMDLQLIHDFIVGSYWAKGIPEATLEKAIRNSLCFGVFTDAGQQVGFARVVTDHATYAWLGDVFVLEPHRGKGLAKWLMANIIAHPELQGLRRMTLATRDAHGLYTQFGFKPLANPQIFMENWKPDIYEHP